MPRVANDDADAGVFGHDVDYGDPCAVTQRIHALRDEDLAEDIDIDDDDLALTSEYDDPSELAHTPRRPRSGVPTLSTAGSMGLIVRDTMVWKSRTTCDASTIGSTPWCG